MIDNLVLAKNYEKLEKVAIEFSKLFKSKEKEFKSHARKASLILALNIVDDKNATREINEKAFQRLSGISLIGSDKKEKIQIYKAKIVIAERLNDISNLIAAATGLYKIPKLSVHDNDFALNYLVWGNELKSNFKKSYLYARKIKNTSMNKTEHSIWLGMLAELAKMPYEKYYNDFIRYTNSRKQANSIRAKFILESKKPWQLLSKNYNKLKFTPDILSDLALELYANSKEQKKVKTIIKTTSIKKTNSARIIMRELYLNEYMKLLNEVKNHKIHSQSQYLLKKSLNKRLNLLKLLEKKANEAIFSQDWLSQLYSLENLKQENLRIANEITSLPVPKNINKIQANEFVRALNEKAKPFIVKAQSIDKKTQSFWDNNALFTSLEEDIKSTSIKVSELLKNELKLLLELAPNSMKNKLSNISKIKTNKYVNNSDLRKAWQDLKNNPLDSNVLLHLKELEERNNSHTIVAYLDIRLAKLDNWSLK